MNTTLFPIKYIVSYTGLSGYEFTAIRFTEAGLKSVTDHCEEFGLNYCVETHSNEGIEWSFNSLH